MDLLVKDFDANVFYPKAMQNDESIHPKSKNVYVITKDMLT